MVKGTERSAICSYTFEAQNITDTERRHMRSIVSAFAGKSVTAYSVILDPSAAHFTSRSDYLRREVEVAGQSDMMLAIIAKGHSNQELALQAGAVIARGGSLVLAYHDTLYGEAPLLESLASSVVSWDRVRDLTDAIKSLVCDNSINDCNTNWQNQRKTA